MGMQIFEESGTFNPAQYGLEVGDVLNVIVVGGGASGGFATAATSSAPAALPGISGGASSFGSYCTAQGGGCGNSIGASLGSHGVFNSQNGVYYCGAGAGGFYPNVQLSNAVTKTAVETEQIFSTGGVDKVVRIGDTVKYLELDLITIGGGTTGEYSSSAKKVTGAKGSLFGIGAGPSVGYGQNLAGIFAGGNGAGYGAGGGAAINKNQNYAGAPIAGNSGEIKCATITLNSINAVSVTVGTGGAEVHSSSNTEYHSGKGAPGVVIVFW